MNLTALLSMLDIRLIGYILLFPIFFLWVIWIIHTTIDIVRRTDSLLYEICCMMLATFLWPLGWFIYLIIRPKFTLEEKAVFGAILANSQECLKCWYQNHQNFHYCVNCGEELKLTCKECKKQYYRWYDYCPHCGAPNIETE